MSIRKKDGSVYTLKKPNPLVKKQKMWADFFDGNLILHNFNWDEQISEKAIEKSPPLNSVAVIEEKPVFASNDIIQEIESVPNIEEVVPEENTPVANAEEMQKTEFKNMLMLHCLPAELKIKKDNLYGDSWGTVQYGKKFIFEAVVVEREDLQFTFWTNKKLLKGSIVYPIKYKDGSSFGDYRWWKVAEFSEIENGYLIKTNMSSHHPDFSD